MTDKHGKSAKSRTGKKPYHRPQLYIYGDVTRLTRAKKLFATTPLDGKTIMIGMFITLRWRS